MNEELGYEVTPKQSLDGLWKTMHKYIEHHGYSDISLELEGSQYEFRQHLQKYDEYEAKAKAWDKTQDLIKDCTGQFDASGEWDTDWCAFGNGIDEIIDKYESGGLDV